MSSIGATPVLPSSNRFYCDSVDKIFLGKFFLAKFGDGAKNSTSFSWIAAASVGYIISNFLILR